MANQRLNTRRRLHLRLLGRSCMVSEVQAGDSPSEKAGSRSTTPLRVVTAAAIFDGHDAAIGIFRRIFQSMGCEVIHLGHDRGADEVARAAIQEDAHAIAITS